MANITDIQHPTLRPEPPCTCIVVDEKYWFSHYGATEPGSMMEFDPTCPEHGDPNAELISDEDHDPAQDQPELAAALQSFIDLDDHLDDCVISAPAVKHEPFTWSFGQGPVTSCKACADAGASEEDAEWPCAHAR